MSDEPGPPRDWSQDEVDDLVIENFAMLRRELFGKKYSKAEHRRALLPRLDGRSESSLEFKHQNIRAVLLENR